MFAVSRLMAVSNSFDTLSPQHTPLLVSAIPIIPLNKVIT